MFWNEEFSLIFAAISWHQRCIQHFKSQPYKMVKLAGKTLWNIYDEAVKIMLFLRKRLSTERF